MRIPRCEKKHHLLTGVSFSGDADVTPEYDAETATRRASRQDGEDDRGYGTEKMKLYVQTPGVSALMISVSSAEPNIYETQTAIMREIPAMLREQTLKDKQIINGCTVTRKLITRQWAERMPYERLRDRMSEGKTYILIVISAGERKKRSAGGGTLIILYDKDTYECLGFCRTK